MPMVKNLVKLRKAFKHRGIPVIYANDNFGKWKSERSQLISECLKPDCLGRTIAESLLPDQDDYFVLKPKHSAFFSTTLDTLLLYLGAKTLVLTGIAGNICVLHTAMDAHIRDYNVIVPEDCVASNSQAENRFALRHLKDVLSTDIKPSQHWIRAVTKRPGLKS
jgi:isochorismate hydrolase